MTHTEMTAGPTLPAPQPRRSASDARPECVSEVLDPFADLGVLRHRVVPGRRASLDWLVVGRFGVFVVDEHCAEGEQPVSVRVRPATGASGPWTVVADGQDHPRALSGARTRGEAVQESLAAAGITGVPVLSVVVFDRASLPPMRRQLRLGQTVVVGLPGLGRLLRSSGALAGEHRARVLEVLDAAFPPAPAGTLDGLDAIDDVEAAELSAS
jgi:hypothetical protein